MRDSIEKSAKPTPPWRLHLVSNTHWDREWYMSFESFRLRLVKLFDRLLAVMARDEAFRSFLLDGQFSALEDYLDLRPERGPEIRALIAAGRLDVGPWYTQPHETMAGGEALIRNLALGIRECRRFGTETRISYNIDQFGHVSQLPQILRGCGIDKAVGWRGVPLDAPAAFRWVGSDGSAVAFFFSNNGYGEATGLPESLDDYDEIREHTPFPRLGLRHRVEKLLTLRTPNSVGPNLLCLSGIDHSFPQENLPRIVELINRECPGVAARHSSLREFAEAVERDLEARGGAWSEYNGELLDPAAAILADVHSARPEVKQANRRIEQLLVDWAEPFAAMAWTAGLLPYPQAALDHAWRILLQNQAHDSHACVSAETVHRQVMSRFDQAEDIAREIAQESMLALTNAACNPAGNELTLCVFNPLGHARGEVVTANIDIPSALPWKHVSIVADGDAEVPAVMEDLGNALHIRYDPLRGHPQHVPVRRWRATFRADGLPAVGFQRLTLRPTAKSRTIPAAGLSVSTDKIENEFLRVELRPDGRFDLTDKLNGNTYRQLLHFEDGGEAGNGFSHQPPAEERVVTSLGQPAEVSICRDTPFEATLQIRRELRIPEGLAPDRLSRSDRLAACGLCTQISLRAGSPRLDIVTTVDNQAGDHRLRLLLPTGIAGAHAMAGMPCDDVRRPPNGGKSVLPFQGRVAVSDGRRGLMIASDDLFEYELADDEASTLALTLLRATDQIGCGFSNPEHALPTAQCLGRRSFRYSLIPFGSDPEPARREARNAVVAPVAVVGHDAEDASLPGYLPPPPLQLQRERLAGLDLSAPEITLCALKRHGQRDSIVLRLLNSSVKACDTTLNLRLPGLTATEVWELDLLEERQRPIPIGSDGKLALGFAPHGIKTVEFKLLKGDTNETFGNQPNHA
jgi:alpha-mannosidase